MSRPKLEEYKQDYSRLISKMVELHNRNRDFTLTPTMKARTDVRKMLQEVRNICRGLRESINGVVAEDKAIRKDLTKQRQYEESLKPPRGQRTMGRPRKYPPKPPKGTRPMGRPRKYPKPVLPPEEEDQG
jgi:hypothetical protein